MVFGSQAYTKDFKHLIVLTIWCHSMKSTFKVKNILCLTWEGFSTDYQKCAPSPDRTYYPDILSIL